MKRVKCLSLLAFIACNLLACTTHYQAPVQEIGASSTNTPRVSTSPTRVAQSFPVERSPTTVRSSTVRASTTNGTHQVSRGETLYSIAFRYDLEYSVLAKINSIAPPYLIYPGQVLALDISKTPSQTIDRKPQRASVSPPVKPVIISNTAITKSRGTGSNNALSIWAWPARGKVIGKYSSVGVENKGINIAGQEGDEVFAAGAGEVVYAGSALLRYGNLLIIKHNEQFLSAYAHNSKLLVAEGDIVSRGQIIAALGSSGIDQEMLHFEIRQNGTPVDPMRFLPSR